jgi:hypothetical protein
VQASDAVLRTNDQWLSVTDQLNLGVRSVELDTHWVEVRENLWGSLDRFHGELHRTAKPFSSLGCLDVLVST